MARTLILGALLGGLAHLAMAAAPTADTAPWGPVAAPQDHQAQDDTGKGDDKPKTDEKKEKKDKVDKITVWTLDATGKG